MSGRERIGWAHYEADQTVAALYSDGTTGSRMRIEEHHMVTALLQDWAREMHGWH